MPIFSASHIGGALAAFIMLTPAVVGSTDAPPPYASATEAYRQGVRAMKSGNAEKALPPLEYAAKHGVLGAQLKLARAYATGKAVPKDEGKAFHYYQHIADQYADIPPSSPIARYVGEAFCALGRFYVDGVPSMPLAASPSYAADLFRHAGAYFGNAEAQYQLARLYLTGAGVEQSRMIAANWLAMATRKQHAGAQAVLGQMLWSGDGVSRRPARGLALLMLAKENARGLADEYGWIGESYEKTVALADKGTVTKAKAQMARLSRTKATRKPVTIAAPTAQARAVPAAKEPTMTARDEPRLGPVDLVPPAAIPPASMGLSVGFGASDTALGGVQP